MKIKALENLLNERFETAVLTDKRMGNENGKEFLPNNPDFIYYKAILDTCIVLGYCYERQIRDGKPVHLLFE